MHEKDVAPEAPVDATTGAEGNTPNGSAVPKTDDKTGTEDIGALTKRLAEAEAARDRNYARAKTAEEKLKSKPSSDTPANPTHETTVDPYSLAKTVSSLKDFDEAEIDYLSTLSKATGKSPTELKASTEFKYWLRGKREEDSTNKLIPPPAGSVASYQLPSSDEIAKMSSQELEVLERKYHAQKKARGGY